MPTIPRPRPRPVSDDEILSAFEGPNRTPSKYTRPMRTAIATGNPDFVLAARRSLAANLRRIDYRPDLILTVTDAVERAIRAEMEGQ